MREACPPEFLVEQSEAKCNASVEQAGQNVARYAFRPWIEQADDEFTLKLLTEDDQDAGYSVSINPDALLRGDTPTQTETIVATVKGRIRTPNEGPQCWDLAGHRALMQMHWEFEGRGATWRGCLTSGKHTGCDHQTLPEQIDPVGCHASFLATVQEKLKTNAVVRPKLCHLLTLGW